MVLLSVVGGRKAVDALRADYERTQFPPTGRAAVNTMATTGSPEDVAFVLKQLAVPDNQDTWIVIQAAATTLGFLRVGEARNELRKLVERTPSNRAPRRAAEWALEHLDRPPCADSAGTDLPRELVRIVMECRPTFLQERLVLKDKATGQAWQFTNDVWRERPLLPTDTTRVTLTADVMIVPEEGVAFINLGMHCGMTCGEGWTYRLRRSGRVWRVIGAEFGWIS